MSKLNFEDAPIPGEAPANQGKQLSLDEYEREEGFRYYDVVEESENLLVGKAVAQERGGKLVLEGLSTDVILGVGGPTSFSEALEEAMVDVQLLKVLVQLEREGVVKFEGIRSNACLVSCDVFPNETFDPVDSEHELTFLVEKKFKEYEARLPNQGEM